MSSSRSGASSFSPNDGSGGLGPPRIVGSLSRAIELVDADGDGQGEILSASNTGIQLFAFQDGVWTLIGDAPNPLPSTYVMAQTPRFDGAPGRRVYLFYRFDTDATIVSLDIDPDGTMTPGPTARLKSVASNIIAGRFPRRAQPRSSPLGRTGVHRLHAEHVRLPPLLTRDTASARSGSEISTPTVRTS
jgi:hypothetical protein